MLSWPDLESLIVYVTAVEALFTLASVAGLLYMRYTRPQLHRPIRVNSILPISFLIIVTVLVVCSSIAHPKEILIGLALIALGVPVYFTFIVWTHKPKWLQSSCDFFNITCSKLFLALPEDSKEL